MENERVALYNIKNLMHKKGISLRLLAKQCDMSAANFSKILNGYIKLNFNTLIKIANNLNVDLQNDILVGIVTTNAMQDNGNKYVNIAILSSNQKILIYICDQSYNLIVNFIVSGELNLLTDHSNIIKLINDNIYLAVKNLSAEKRNFVLNSNIKLKLLVQSYDITSKRNSFYHMSLKFFDKVYLYPNWFINLYSNFNNADGIILFLDKNITLAYNYNNIVKRIGGWQYPLYDLGGENYLGIATIRHTIEVLNDYIPMTGLANHVIAKCNGSIENICEMCLCSNDVNKYAVFHEMLLHCYFTGELEAKKIIEKSVNHIKKLINVADKKIGRKLKIAVSGSLARIYAPFLDQSRLVIAVSETKQLQILVKMKNDFYETR